MLDVIKVAYAAFKRIFVQVEHGFMLRKTEWIFSSRSYGDRKELQGEYNASMMRNSSWNWDLVEKEKPKIYHSVKFFTIIYYYMESKLYYISNVKYILYNV